MISENFNQVVPALIKLSHPQNGAGDGNRTHVCSLGSCRSAIELRPLGCSMIAGAAIISRPIRPIIRLKMFRQFQTLLLIIAAEALPVNHIWGLR